MSVILNEASTILVAVALAVVPATGLAAGNTSTGSFNVDVTIPPFGAGLAATAEGAAGFSTLDSPGGGLLVEAPDRVSSGGQGEISVFSLAGMNVTARLISSVPGASFASITTGRTTPFKGMSRTTFVLTANQSTPGAGNNPARTVSVVVGAL